MPEVTFAEPSPSFNDSTRSLKRHSDTDIYANRRMSKGFHWALRSFAKDIDAEFENEEEEEGKQQEEKNVKENKTATKTQEDEEEEESEYTEDEEWLHPNQQQQRAKTERAPLPPSPPPSEDTMTSSGRIIPDFGKGSPSPFHHREAGWKKSDSAPVPKNRKQRRLRKSGVAAEIFCQDARHDAKTPQNNTTYSRQRVGLVDGREVVFELKENVTQRPTTDRRERLRRSHVNLNCEPSSIESQFRFWLMKRTVMTLSAIYLACFVALNLTFAGLFFIDEYKCCDDPDLSFGEVFAFSVQTSTTIGYGGFTPAGHYANFLVIALNFVTTLLNTIFAGLIFARFVKPEAKLIFSDVMSYCNFNGLPCLQFRVGNADGPSNILTNVEARLTYIYFIEYEDENGNTHKFGQTEELKLLNDKQQIMHGVWTLRHVLDEKSPLFGLDLFKYPGTSIIEFRASITGIQEITQASITEQTGYTREDVLIGHAFRDQSSWDPVNKIVYHDYSKLDETHPQPVWYPTDRVDILP